MEFLIWESDRKRRDNGTKEHKCEIAGMFEKHRKSKIEGGATITNVGRDLATHRITSLCTFWKFLDLTRVIYKSVFKALCCSLVSLVWLSVRLVSSGRDGLLLVGSLRPLICPSDGAMRVEGARSCFRWFGSVCTYCGPVLVGSARSWGVQRREHSRQGLFKDQLLASTC